MGVGSFDLWIVAFSLASLVALFGLRQDDADSDVSSVFQGESCENPELGQSGLRVIQIGSGGGQSFQRWGVNNELKGGSLGEGDSDRILGLRAWCETDPEAMIGWVISNLAGKDRETALKQAAVVWFAADPDSTTRWAESLPEDFGRNAVLMEIGFEMARVRPEGAVELASKLPYSSMRDELLVHAVRQWGGMDASAASSWASQLPESRLRQEVLSALAVSLAVSSGEEAAGIVARSIAAGKGQEDSAVLVARGWGILDPEAAADWIAGFQDPGVRDAAIRGLAAVWSERAPDRMATWIGSLGDESIRLQMLDAVRSLQGRARPAVEDPVVDGSP